MVILDEGQLYYVLDRELITPGNWRAILNLKVKNMKTGSITVNRVKPEDKVDQAYLEKRELEYIYQDGDGYVFMDTENYDQTTLQKDFVEEQMIFMKEGFRSE